MERTEKIQGETENGHEEEEYVSGASDDEKLDSRDEITIRGVGGEGGRGR